MKRLLTVFFITITAHAFSQQINSGWKEALNNALQQFNTCERTPSDITKCNHFTGESLKTVYNINDFYSDKNGRYLTPWEISRFLKDNKQWTILGPSYDQKTLTTAQTHANANKAVVAVYTNAAGNGHVVLITPGQLQVSGSWGLNVPTAASFFFTEPDKSFVGKGLSFAFGKNMIKDVVIYGRNY